MARMCRNKFRAACERPLGLQMGHAALLCKMVAGLVLCMCWWWEAQAAEPAAQWRASTLQARLQQAQTQPDVAEALYDMGRKVATVCVHCHGHRSDQTFFEVPYLDGQNPAYLIEQMRQFSQGIRKNAFMEGILKALSVDEVVGMALFYAQQPLPARAPKEVALLAKGQAHYARICVACHGADGHGNAQHPRLAGQHAGYVELTLQRYRAGSSTRSNPTMGMVAQSMSDQDIQAVAAYLVTLP